MWLHYAQTVTERGTRDIRTLEGEKKSWCCDGLGSTVPWRLEVTWRWCCEASRSARNPRINLKNKCVRSLNGSRIDTRRRDKVEVSDRGVICRRASAASWRYRFHRKRLFYLSQTTHPWQLFQRVRIAKKPYDTIRASRITRQTLTTKCMIQYQYREEQNWVQHEMRRHVVTTWRIIEKTNLFHHFWNINDIIDSHTGLIHDSTKLMRYCLEFRILELFVRLPVWCHHATCGPDR